MVQIRGNDRFGRQTSASGGNPPNKRKPKRGADAPFGRGSVSGSPSTGELGTVYQQPVPDQSHTGVSRQRVNVSADGNKPRNDTPTGGTVSGWGRDLGPHDKING